MASPTARDEAIRGGSAGSAPAFGAGSPFAHFTRPRDRGRAPPDPVELLERNLALCSDLLEIAAGSSSIAPDPHDGRFQHPAWTSNPFYRGLAQTYLAVSDAIEKSVPDGLAPDSRARAQLAATILTSALAPTNLLAGNPAAILRTIETGGGNLSKGFSNFLDDLLNNGGLPSQVDDSGFEVGRNLAVTEGKVVHRTEMFELIQYRPTTGTVREIPVLVVPPQIGRYYFTDLAPGRSLAEYAVGQGLQQFVISWRNPQPEHRHWGLDDYLAAALEAAEATAAIAGQPKLNLMGFCAGGIVATLLAGHLAAKRRDLLNTLTLCVTLLDFDTDAAIGGFRLPGLLSVARAKSEASGVLAGPDLHKVFTWLRPNDLVWNYWVNNYLMGESPAAFDILAWNKDSTNLPARLHSDFLELFETDRLGEPGGHSAMEQPVDLAAIACDNFIVGAVTDHITPWHACYKSSGFLGGTSTFALSNGGHVAALVNPPDNPKAFHWIGAAPAGDAEEWLAGAEKTTGSWWQSWAAWIGERSGAAVPAPEHLGSAAHPPQADAPGEYVRE